MAIKEFWISVRTAARLMVPRVAVDSPGLDRSRTEGILRASTLWLTPGAVKGYDPRDFEFLSDEERAKLDQGVDEFKAVAGPSWKRGPATDEQVAMGLDGFRKIVEVMRPDRYADLDAFVIGKKIEGMIADEVPDWVREITFKTDLDSIGEPALHISVLAEDAALDDSVIRENARVVQDLLAEAAFEVCPERFPYFHFRTVSEYERASRADRG